MDRARVLLLCLAGLVLAGQLCAAQSQVDLAQIESLVTDGTLQDPAELSLLLSGLINTVAKFPYGNEYRPDFAGFPFVNDMVQTNDTQNSNNLNQLDLGAELALIGGALQGLSSFVASVLVSLSKGAL